MKFRYALPARCFSRDLKQAFRDIAALQVEGIQLDLRNELRPGELGESGVKQFLKQLEEQNLRVASTAFPLRKPLAEPELLDARLEAIRAAMAFTFQLKTPILTLRPGTLPDPESAPEQWELLCDVLNDLTRFGNHIGTTLCLSLSFEFPARVRRLFADVTAGPLGINFDPLNAVGGPQSPGESFREFHRVIQHVRARDGLSDQDGTIEETVLGRGEVDWTELIALLQEASYSGWILLDRISGENAPRDLAYGLKYLKNLLPF
ncbi:MAG TPA: sugar phosphate isomerase/epimerase family protein [Planctomycetaceae bacterium]|nr:sugar phosphate isomerase/epimerase family protein [Planctomycetaceae bacterium]